MYVIVLFHTKVPELHGGFIAVNLFFVLSGYLVTSLIVAELERKGRVDVGRFYARRVRRLLPAAVAAILGISLLFVLVVPVVRRVAVIGDAQSSLLYYANWRFIAQSTDYFATDVDKSPFLHFWTLSIEEQFYVAFPLLLLLLLKLGGRRAALVGTAALTMLSLVAQFSWAGRVPMHAYFGTDARAYQLLAGVLLALVMAWWPVRVSGRAAVAMAVTGVIAFGLLCTTLVPLSQSVRGVAGTVACVLIVGGLMHKEDQVIGRVLSTRVPVYLGQISYSTYLWHWPAILVMSMVLDVRPVVMALLAGVLATAMAAASAELLELPIRRASRLDPHRWTTVVSGVTVSALAAVLVVPAILAWDRSPDLVAAKVKGPTVPLDPSAQPEPLPKGVDWDQVKSDKGRSVSCPDNPDDCIVHRGSGPTVVLIGDSHGAMLADMWLTLAREHDFTLALDTVLGCPWQENLKNVHSSPDRQARCTAARVGWYDDVLPKLDPDLVVLAGFPRDAKRWNKQIELRDGSPDSLEVATLKATRDTLGKIDKVAKRVLLTQTIVTANSFDPNECMTSTEDPQECAVPVPTRVSATDGYYLTAATENDNFYSVDLNPAFCPSAPLCQPVVDGEVVWRDREHLTPPFATHRADKAWKLIEKTGVFDGLR